MHLHDFKVEIILIFHISFIFELKMYRHKQVMDKPPLRNSFHLNLFAINCCVAAPSRYMFSHNWWLRVLIKLKRASSNFNLLTEVLILWGRLKLMLQAQ